MSVTGNDTSGKRKDFRCPLCGRTFEDEITLEQHKKKEHSEEAEPPAGVG